MEAAYHGSPAVCIPRTFDEKRNAQRALELGFAFSEKSEALSDSIVQTITEIHESTKYRENARLVSQAIRDRSNHAMDRIQYWLGYTARHSGEGKNLLVPRKVTTHAETLQGVAGFFVGVLFTVCGTILFFITQAMTDNKERKKKHKK